MGKIVKKASINTRAFKFYTKAILVAQKKNNDYSKIEDPLYNLRECEKISVSTEKGIMVRLSDKRARLSNLVNPEHIVKVKGEKLIDTTLDQINYLFLMNQSIVNKFPTREELFEFITSRYTKLKTVFSEYIETHQQEIEGITNTSESMALWVSRLEEQYIDLAKYLDFPLSFWVFRKRYIERLEKKIFDLCISLTMIYLTSLERRP